MKNKRAVTTTKTNKPLNPRGNDQSPLAYNRAKLYSGKALDFDGVNDEIDLGTQSFITASGFSISTYLNIDDNSEHYIFSTGYSNADSLLFYSAASSTTFGISNAYADIISGKAETVLVINPEITTAHNNHKSRETHLFLVMYVPLLLSAPSHLMNLIKLSAINWLLNFQII